MSLQKEIEPINAIPTKRIFLSIIADYNLRTAICELTDNAIDAWRSSSKSKPLRIEIDINTEQQSLTIEDNASGVRKTELKKLISPGESSVSVADDTIGYFGVGSKRAVVALAKNIRILTRFGNDKTYCFTYDDKWLESEGWELPCFEVDSIEENSTIIELSVLRFGITEADVENLIEQLSIAYARFISDDNIQIVVNEVPIESRFFDQWAYPVEYEPSRFRIPVIEKKSGKQINCELVFGLTYEPGSIGGDYGVFFYCNRRLITRALKSSEVGFTSGLAGLPHADMSLARILISLTGPPELMPWTSKKDGINYNHLTFQHIKHDVIEAVKNCTSFSKRLKKDFKVKVEPFKTGTIHDTRLNSSDSIKRSQLPSPPRARSDYKEDVVSLNKALGSVKPWIKGLYETMIADEVISRHKILTQRNRISLILLDSTIEIGCKEYLANELQPKWSDGEILKLSRRKVHDEVKKHVFVGSGIWDTLDYYYKIRNELIHKRVNLYVHDDDIEKFRINVRAFLNEAFGIRFPE